MKRMNLSLDDVTYRNLRALAALKDFSVAKLIKHFVDREIIENPDECELCRKYGHEPNEETRKTFEDTDKGKGLSKVYHSSKKMMKDILRDDSKK